MIKTVWSKVRLTREGANREVIQRLERSDREIDRFCVVTSRAFVGNSHCDRLAIVQVGDLNLLTTVTSTTVNS